MTVTEAINSINGLNQEYPSSPQYNVSERAAPVETVAIPNITSTIDGRQHMDAIIEELATSFQRERGFFCSMGSAKSSSFMCYVQCFSKKNIVFLKHHFSSSRSASKFEL
tara:strand:- start:2290 stop:2619 length:330 start_codon:yes stop_codon:yes gene_type:complete